MSDLAEIIAAHRLAFFGEYRCSCREWRPVIVGDGADASGVPMYRQHADHLADILSARLAAVEQRVADARAEERERIASAIEARASRASYAWPEEITDTYLDAARIAREARP